MEHAGLEIVVVAYGPVDLLRTCLDALGPEFPVHVVDNGLSDEVAGLAAERGLDYVRPAENVGFGAAVNLGLARSGAGADVLLLNPDARVDPAAVRALQCELHAAKRRAAVAPTLRRPDGSHEPTRWPFPTPWLPWRGLVGRGSLRPGESFFVSGAVLLLSAEALEEVGPFDERFFLYAEETDWQRRARSCGFDVREVPQVTAEHVGAATSSDSLLRDLHFHGSAELYVRKWFGGRGWWIFRAGSLAAALRRAVTATDRDGRRRALRAARLYVLGPAHALRLARC